MTKRRYNLRKGGTPRGYVREEHIQPKTMQERYDELMKEIAAIQTCMFSVSQHLPERQTTYNALQELEGKKFKEFNELMEEGEREGWTGKPIERVGAGQTSPTSDSRASLTDQTP